MARTLSARGDVAGTGGGEELWQDSEMAEAALATSHWENGEISAIRSALLDPGD